MVLLFYVANTTTQLRFFYENINVDALPWCHLWGDL